MWFEGFEMGFFGLLDLEGREREEKAKKKGLPIRESNPDLVREKHIY